MKRLLFLIMLAMPAIVLAQTYPTKPVKLVVPYAAGGGVDTVARALAQELSGGLGQPVVVENRPGANSLIGTDVGFTVLPLETLAFISTSQVSAAGDVAVTAQDLIEISAFLSNSAEASGNTSRNVAVIILSP